MASTVVNRKLNRSVDSDDTSTSENASCSVSTPMLFIFLIFFTECVICMEVPTDCVFCECGHLLSCMECVKICTLCRVEIRQRIKVFM